MIKVFDNQGWWIATVNTQAEADKIAKDLRA